MNRRCLLWTIVLCHVFCWTGVQAQAQSSGVAPTVLVLPKGPGSLGGVGENVQANLNMGVMSYKIDIALPEGRTEFTPDMSLRYSSGAGAGIVGMGWRLSGAESIERLTVRGLPRYGTIKDPSTNRPDRFYASQGGELVNLPNTPLYRARYEGGFVRYRWHQNEKQQGYWTAEFPNGSIGFYGATYTQNAARKVDVTQGKVDLDSHVFGPQGTFRWHLRSLVDANGNRIEYRYIRDGKQVYLSTVSWVFSKTGESLYQARLLYEVRPDPISDSKPGFDCVTTKRLARIEILSTGKSFRTYQLSYESNSQLSRLESVTQLGNDGKTPYPIRFTMQYSSADYDAKNASIVKFPTSVGQDFTTRNSDLLDMNGDGLPDVVDTSRPKHRFHFNTMTVKALKPDTHDFAAPVENKDTTNARLSNPAVQMLDFNGDGFTDIVDAVNKTIYINRGQGRWEDQSAKLLSTFPSPGQNPNRRFFDFNGDKAIDVMEINGPNIVYWVSDGKGTWHKALGSQSIGADFAKDKCRLIDMNGDNLADIVQIFGGQLRYRRNFGYGRWSDWINVKVQGLSQSLTDKARFRDINGDGLADMVAFVANSVKFFVNKNGVEFSKGEDLNAKFKGIDIPDSDPRRVTIRIADMNGNGSRDIVWLDASGKITYLELFGIRPNLLTSVENGIGKRIEVTYGSSIYHALRDKAAGKAWPSKLPLPFLVVNQIKTWSQISKSDKAAGCPTVQRIQYHDGFYDGVEKKFRGFRRVESTQVGDQGKDCPRSIGTRTEALRFFVGDSSKDDKDNYYHGRLREKTVSGSTHDNKNVTFFAQRLTWQDCQVAGVKGKLNPPVRYICVKDQEQTIQEGTAQAKWKTLRTEYTYDGYGNTIQTNNLGNKDAKGDEKLVKMTYATPKDPNDISPANRWFLRLPQRSEICQGPAGPCVQQNYFYDGTAFEGLEAGQRTRGNLSRSSTRTGENGKEINIQRFDYDVYGNIVGIKDPNGNLRTATWDKAFERFPTTETIHLKDRKLVASTEWDVRYGFVRQSTNYNGHKTFYAYDVFSRLTRVIRPGDSPQKPTEEYSYKMEAPFSQLTLKQRSKVGGDPDLVQVKCFDGMGRLIQTRGRLAGGQWMVTGHVQYNSEGQLAQKWNTYTASSSDCQYKAPAATPVVQQFYDGLGRTIRSVDQNGGVNKIVYAPLRQQLFDPEDNSKDSPHFNTPTTNIFDGLGRLLSSETMSAQDKRHLKSFAWNFMNIFGSDIAVDVTDSMKQRKQQKIDWLGRVTQVVDPDRGTISYTYDAVGNMLQRKDAAGKAVVYTYDALNRQTSIQTKDKPDTKVTFVYDKAMTNLASATNLKGELAGIRYPGGAYEFGYDRRKRLTHMRKQHLGHNFDFQMEHDNASRLVKKTYPDGRALVYKYDAASRIKGIEGFIKDVTYLPNGMMQTMTLANGLKESYAYNKKLHIQKIQVAEGSIFDLRYVYDRYRNITSIQKKIGNDNETHKYQYDSLYRLRQADIGSAETLKYQFSDNGNILSKVSSLEKKSLAHLGNYVYDAKRPRAVVSAGPMTLTYDKVGQVSKCQNKSFVWDARRRLQSVANPGATSTQFWYGYGMKRIMKREGERYTHYITDDYELHKGVPTIHVKLRHMRVATWSAPKSKLSFYDDIASASGNPASGNKPDGQITAADAWLYQQGQQKKQTRTLKKRPLAVNLTTDMLQASAQRMLVEQEKKQGTKLFYHSDHLGSVMAATDEAGKLVSTQRYYPYGGVRKSTGHRLRYGYMSTERDALTGLNYAHKRYLDTALGRWISADPEFDLIQGSGDEFNSYWYAMNNPVRFRDSSGTSSEDGLDATQIGKIAMGSTLLAVGAGFVIADLIKMNRTNAFKGKLGVAKVSSLTLGTLTVAAGLTAVSVSDPEMANGFGFAAAALAIATMTVRMGVSSYEAHKAKGNKAPNQSSRSLGNQSAQSSNRSIAAQRSNSNLQRQVSSTSTFSRSSMSIRGFPGPRQNSLTSMRSVSVTASTRSLGSGKAQGLSRSRSLGSLSAKTSSSKSLGAKTKRSKSMRSLRSKK